VERASFYNQLDELYLNGDQRAIEAYILDMAQTYSANGDTVQWVMAMNELGSFYRGASRFDLSIKSFSEVLDTIAQYLGKENLNYAVTLNNLAGVYRMMGDHSIALQLFLKSKSIYHDCDFKVDVTYIALLNNIALAYQGSGNLKESEQNLLEALKELEKIPDCDVEKATTMNNLATLYLRMKKIEDSKIVLNKALLIFSEKRYSDNPHHAAALNLMGNICCKEEDYTSALPLFQKAICITEKFFGRNHDYAMACESLGAAYIKAGFQKEAIESLQKALAAFNDIQGMHDRSQRIQQYLENMRSEGMAQ